jgi:hypothetical protein
MGFVIDPETNLYLKEIMKKGEIRDIKKSIKKLYIKKKLSPEERAEILDVPLNLVKEAIEEIEKD